MNESINFMGAYLAGFISCIILLGLALILLPKFIKIPGPDDPAPEPETKKNNYPDGMDMVARLQSLYHLPERDDKKNRERWLFNQALGYIVKARAALMTLQQHYDKEILLINDQLDHLINNLNTIITYYLQHPGTITQEELDRLDEEMGSLKMSPEDKEYHRELRDNPTRNPVIERNQGSIYGQ